MTGQNVAGAGELLAQLRAEHVANRYIYRGQTVRHQHTWLIDETPTTLESLYPSDYRFITGFSRTDADLEHHVSAAREHGRNLRDGFFTFMLAAIWDDKGRYRPLLNRLAEDPQPQGGTAGWSVHPFFHALWSLAQHYVLATALVDVTFEPDVALWFATNEWDGAPTARGTGVVYRMDCARLEEVLQACSIANALMAAQAGEQASPPYFVADIRDIPLDIAGRPAGQHGGSVYGFDSPYVLHQLLHRGAVDIFTFAHGEAPALRVSREDIMPQDDPFLAECERFRQLRKASSPETVRATQGAGGQSDWLERVASVMRIPIRRATLVEETDIGEGAAYRCVLFTDVEATGEIQYLHILAVFAKSTRAVVVAVSAEVLNHGLPLAAVDALQKRTGLGGGLCLRAWGREGSWTVDICNEIAELTAFRVRAMQLADEALGKLM